MRKILCVAILSLLITAGCVAVSRVSAQDSSGEYAWRDGFWWKGNVAYSRVQVYNPVVYRYDNYGQKYAEQQTYYWKYTVAPQALKYHKDWQAEHSEIMKAIAAFNGTNKLVATDRAAFLASLKIIQESLKPQPGEVGYGLFSQGGLPFQGTTAYGPSAYGNYATVNARAGNYMNTIDINVFLTGITRLASRSNEGSIELIKNTQELAGQLIDNQARLLAAQSQVTISASAGGGAARARIGPANPGAVGGVNPAIGPSIVGNELAQAKAVLDSRCISCHAGAASKGGLDLSNVTLISPQAWVKVVQRTPSTTPANLLMPKGGPALSDDEFVALVNGAALAMKMATGR